MSLLIDSYRFAAPAVPTTTRYEQDHASVTYPVGSWNNYGGFTGKYSNTIAAKVSFAYTVPGGQTGYVNFYGGSVAGGPIRWRIDGGAWNDATQTGAFGHLDFTTGSVAAGAHTLEVERVGGFESSNIMVDAFETVTV